MVTKLRGDAPLLTDIPGQLRQMADMIDAGTFRGNKALFVMVDESVEHPDWPMIYGWGDAFGDHEIIGLLEVAKAFFVINSTKRFA